MPRPTPLVRRLVLGTAVGLGLWAAVVALTGGGAVDLGGVRLSSRAASRPAIAAVLLALVGALGTTADERRRALAGIRRLADRLAPACALALAIALAATSAVFNEHVAGSADSSGYLSQSRLWAAGRVSVDAPVYTDDPWPDRGWLVSPLGFAPSASPDRLGPSYAPGLPWLMALGAAVAGEPGRYVWTPLAAGLLAWLTFAFTRRHAPPTVALASAALVVVSPPVLFAAMQTMSDLVCASLWTLALLAATRPGLRSTAIAGLAAALALAVRPNLVAVAAGVWIVAVARSPGAWTPRLARAALLAVPMAAAALAVAAINRHLWGSPFASGYGATEDLFLVSNVSGNLSRLWRWTRETGGIWTLLGVPALAWLAAVHRRLEWLVACAIVAGVVVSYLPYAHFEEWWYLRFYLPAWPLAAGAVTTAAWHARGRIPDDVAALAILGASLALVGPSLEVARGVGTFELWRGAQRYPAVAGFVAAEAPANALVLSVQHSGALRYAGGRTVGRWDYVAPDGLDRTVERLAAAGRAVWLVVDDLEEGPFRARFAAMRRGALDWAPLAEVRIGAARTRVYDLTTPTRAVAPALIGAGGSGPWPWRRRPPATAK